MENKSEKKLEPYFYEPLVQMGFIPRVIVRIALNIFTAVFIITTAAFLMSPISSFFYLGAFFFLVIAEKVTNSGLPPKRIPDLPKNGRVNLADYLSSHTRRAIILAHENSKISRENFLLRLALYLFEDGEVAESVNRLDLNPEELKEKLGSYVKESKGFYAEKEVQRIIKQIITEALRIAYYGNADFIGCAELFAAIAKFDDKYITKLTDVFGIKSGDLEKALIFGRVRRMSIFRSLPKTIGGFAQRRLRSRVINRAWTSRPTPTLDRFAQDYAAIARSREFALMIGHEEEYERLLNILSSPIKPNAILVGEPEIGKEVIIRHLAYMISRDKVPSRLFDKRLVSLDINSLLAGADQAELQARIQKVCQEVYAAGNIILYIPDIHNLTRTGAPKQISAANAIIPLIVSNDFPLIGATYPKEYKTCIEPDGSFANSFETIKVKEVSLDDALKIMIYKSIILENEYKIKIGYNAVKTAVELADKYFRAMPLPGSAGKLLKEALSYAARRGDKLLNSTDVIAVAESRINIPINKAGKDEARKLLDMENIIHEKLVDQDAAVSAVSNALREYRSGLGRKGGPIGTFLFVGPTGVGKTELSKILSKIQFGSEDAMIRFDMSEYQDKTSAFQMIGSPNGEMAGILTDRVLEKPYSLILLDEFEKAHSDILNLFLQVFDDGRLTDNFGRVVSFENTIIIATSNANSVFIKEELEKGRSASDIAVDLKKKLSGFFKPELLNRFSSIVVFKDLSRGDIRKITAMNLSGLSAVLKESEGIEINFAEEAVSKIAELGYDPVFGARPLRAVISEKIKNPLSKMILSDKLGRGAQIKVELENGEIIMRVIS